MNAFKEAEGKQAGSDSESDDYTVQEVIDKRTTAGGETEYLVQWEGFGSDDMLGAAVLRDGGGRVVVLLLDGLPHAVFYHLAQTGLDVGLALDQLGLDE